MTKTKSATQAMQDIQSIARVSRPALRQLPDNIADKNGTRQGDVYLLLLGKSSSNSKTVQSYVDAMRASATPKETTLRNLPDKLGALTKVRQVAVGDTQGSRHIAEGNLRVYARPEGCFALVGPIVVADEPWTLTHPEHGHIRCPAGAYQVLYQRDYAQERAEEIRRVQD